MVPQVIPDGALIVGSADRARYWYGRFLHDWRSADPGTPEVEDAKRRLAALGGPPPEGA